MLPVKTFRAVASVAALLLAPLAVPQWAAYRFIEPDTIAQVWELPLPVDVTPPLPETEVFKAVRTEALKPRALVDPQHNLDYFYEALHKGGMVRAVHFGDSPTTADLITADVRGMLQKQFGDAGAGYVLIARPWAWYAHRGMGMSSSNWAIDVAGRPEFKDGLFGLGGGRFRGSAGSTASWTLTAGQARSVEVAFMAQPEGGSFVFEADGEEVGSASTVAEEAQPGYVTFALPAHTSKMTLRVTEGHVKLFGVEFRRDRPGILYSSLGVNGASVTLLSRAFNRAHLTAQLRHYRPALVVLAYGTNESGFPNFVDSTWVGEMETVVKRVQSALPEASILLMSPMDRGELKKDGSIGTVDALPRLVEKEQKLAEEMGVAFFNTFQAMGGQGTMARWYASQPRLVGADYIHPLPAGAKIVGELLYEELRKGFGTFKLRKLEEEAEQERKREQERQQRSRQRAHTQFKNPAGVTSGSTVQ
jgi:lysophospholipase L1-like esterase